MKWLYKEYEMNGVIRIGEMTTVPDDTPNASTIYVGNLLDADGLECYRLQGCDPIYVGPRTRSREEIEKAVRAKVNSEFPQEKREELIELATNSGLEGREVPKEYSDYKKRKVAIRSEIEAIEAAKTYKGVL